MRETIHFIIDNTGTSDVFSIIITFITAVASRNLIILRGRNERQTVKVDLGHSRLLCCLKLGTATFRKQTSRPSANQKACGSGSSFVPLRAVREFARVCGCDLWYESTLGCWQD